MLFISGKCNKHREKFNDFARKLFAPSKFLFFILYLYLMIIQRQTTLVPLQLSHPHEIENSTNMQFRPVIDEFPDRKTVVFGEEDLLYGYSVAQEHPSTSISPVSVDSSTSYFQNEQLPLNRFLTPIIPHYTPALPYRSLSPHVPAPTALYRTPGSFHQEFSESPRCGEF